MDGDGNVIATGDGEVLVGRTAVRVIRVPVMVTRVSQIPDMDQDMAAEDVAIKVRVSREDSYLFLLRFCDEQVTVDGSSSGHTRMRVCTTYVCCEIFATCSLCRI